MKKLKVYISGPMSAEDEVKFRENLRHFHAAEHQLRKQGYRVMNPANVWACRWKWLYRLLGLRIQFIKSRRPLLVRFDPDLAYRRVLLYDLWLVTRTGQLCMISGWRHSRGACVENTVARRLAIPHVFNFDPETQQLSVYGGYQSDQKRGPKKKGKHDMQGKGRL